MAAGKQSATSNQTLCGSAKSVPAAVPKGRKYQPSGKDGKDFETGTTSDGWRCLRFTLSGPMYYRYSYIKGTSGLVAPKNPAKPPAAGFEIAAQGDLDGDGILSTLALTGTVQPTTNVLAMATGIYRENETD